MVTESWNADPPNATGRCARGAARPIKIRGPCLRCLPFLPTYQSEVTRAHAWRRGAAAPTRPNLLEARTARTSRPLVPLSPSPPLPSAVSGATAHATRAALQQWCRPRAQPAAQARSAPLRGGLPSRMHTAVRRGAFLDATCKCAGDYAGGNALDAQRAGGNRRGGACSADLIA